MRANDIAAKALSNSRLRQLQWMALSRIKRGETLKLEGFNEKLMLLLEKRSREIEKDAKAEPKSVTDWMALALFAKNRNALALKCYYAEQRKDKSYKQATYWLNRLLDTENEKTSSR